MGIPFQIHPMNVKPCITIKMEISYISEQKYKFWHLPEEQANQTICNLKTFSNRSKELGQAPMLLIIDVPDS